MNEDTLNYPIILIDQEKVCYYSNKDGLQKWRRKMALDPLLHYGLEIIDSSGNSFYIKKVILKEPENIFSKLDFLGNSWVKVELELAFHKSLDLEIMKMKFCRILMVCNNIRPNYFRGNYQEMILQIKQASCFGEIFKLMQSELYV